MKSFLVVLIVSAGIGCAQSSSDGHIKPADLGKNPPQSGNKVLVCKLESVTWNPETEELSWVISTHDVAAAQDQPDAAEKYTIHIDTAVMNFNGEGRHFDPDEAKRVGALMDLISTYTVESTVWWAKGMGEKLNPNDTTPPQKKGSEKGTDDKSKPVHVLRAPSIDAPSAPGESSRQLVQSARIHPD
jgi:hypothetical protein